MIMYASAMAFTYGFQVLLIEVLDRVMTYNSTLFICTYFSPYCLDLGYDTDKLYLAEMKLTTHQLL